MRHALPIIALALVLTLPALANDRPDEFDQFALSCEFPTIPNVIMSFSRTNVDLSGVITVGGRGPVVMALGSGSTRFETANIDGYHFRWSPANSVMDVEKDDETILSETGVCAGAQFGADQPLNF
ncbi:hypothetical protein [Paracoccus aminophilus]|uniref:hypothetical protein n=1 Tax=Paracoccus aminophilus TaxID=34003 RepID=UPI0005A078DA|nr:hypothetical protein [Paracoccus aminophilus]